MRNVQKSPVEQYFSLFLSSAAARGVKDKTLQTYKQHFHSISKSMDVTVPMDCLNSSDLDNMILKMREEGLSDCSINSYTRTLKVFFSWCNEEGHSNLNIKLYKAAETVKEVYTDDELLVLLKKPEANCNFCEYRNWVIINFLLNSGCGGDAFSLQRLMGHSTLKMTRHYFPFWVLLWVSRMPKSFCN